MDEPAISMRPREMASRLRSWALVMAVLLFTVGVSYGLFKVFRPKSTPPPTSPLGNGKIAFVGLSDPDGAGSNDIFAVNPDGSGPQQLTDDPAPDHSPAWSPDGTKIAFAREGRLDPGGEVSTSIYVMNADGSDVTRVTTEEGVHDASPSWSPDGSMIAFSSNRDGFSDIWAVSPNGTGLRRLTDLSTQGVDYASLPAWSPDGSAIAFRRSPMEPSGELKPQGIWSVEVDTGELRQLTRGPILDEDASWSPDGRRMAFSRKIWTGSSAYTDVYVADLDEGTEVPLARGGDPSWSPDGTRIAFSGGRSREEHGIYIMDADGSDLVQVPTPTVLGYSPISPAWQPLPPAPRPSPSVAMGAPGVPTPAPSADPQTIPETLEIEAELLRDSINVTNQNDFAWSECHPHIATRLRELDPFGHPVLQRIRSGESVMLSIEKFEQLALTSERLTIETFARLPWKRLILVCETPEGSAFGQVEWGPKPGPPDGPGAVIGVSYPFDLYTHCGVVSARFDGRDWNADPPLLDDYGANPPSGWGNPFDRGTMTLLEPDLAEYRSDAGQIARFRPRPAGEHDPAAGCE